MKKGKTFIVSGPSGVGKSTVLQALLSKRDDLYFSVSATTRPAREGETDGVHYHFLDVETFQQWIAEDQFLEYAEYVGNFYGTPKRFVDEAMEQGKDVILDIEIQRDSNRGQAAGDNPHFHRPAQLGGAGTPAQLTGNGQPGENPKAAGPG